MRCVLVAPPWVPVPPPSYGGTEAVVDQLAVGLQDAGHEVVLCASGDSSCPVPVASCFEEAPAGAIGDTEVELRHVLHAYEVVRSLGPVDVVHDHTLLGAAVAGGHLPLVTTNHGPFDPAHVAIFRALARKAAVVAISHGQARTAPEVPIARVIHHGVDPDSFPVGDGQGGYAAFLGRMAPAKGVDAAIRVARAAGVPLRIAAKMREPVERDYFEQAVRPLLGDGVEYLGEVGAADKRALLGRAVALLNPIRWDEPFGMVMIEALACGTPVIAFARGSAPEIVEDAVTGYLGRTESDLVEALVTAERLDRGACRAAVATRFCSRRMVDRHVELYEAVAAGRWATGPDGPSDPVDGPLGAAGPRSSPLGRGAQASQA